MFMTKSITSEIQRPYSKLAVASLIVAAIGFLNILGFVAALVLAHMALWKLRVARKQQEPLRGRRLAITALLLSYSCIIFTVIVFSVMWFIVLLMPSVWPDAENKVVPVEMPVPGPTAQSNDDTLAGRQRLRRASTENDTNTC